MFTHRSPSKVKANISSTTKTHLIRGAFYLFLLLPAFVNLLPLNFFYITEVLVMGEYSQGGGPASSFNVYLYRDAPGHLPGELIQALLNQPYTGTPPDFTIHLTSGLLDSGTYWISVQAV